ncbi:MAG: four helix bundle protein [Proteobacteria bacterium]|nr:four helix bundle protein [Pseudomonadota bacterium]
MSYIGYEDLKVYKLSRRLAIELHKLSLEWPKTEQFGGIADQLRRSSRSVCANIAEGLSKNMSVADKVKFIQIALGSAEESRVWLDFCGEFGYLQSMQVAQYRLDYQEVSRMLYALQQSMRKK